MTDAPPPAGFYPDPQPPHEARWWNGSSWAADIDLGTRQAALSHILGARLARGGVVADRGDVWVVVTEVIPATRVNHVTHFVLCVFTCFLWLPFWMLTTVLAKPARTKAIRVEVDRYGRVSERKLR